MVLRVTFTLHCLLSCCSCVRLFETLWTITHQDPLPMGFSRQETWSGLPLPSPEMQETLVQFLGREDPLEKG